MTVQMLADTLACKISAGRDALARPVEGCCCGDLLSWMMTRTGPGDAWVTVMGNVNAVAVASLADAACILLAEGAQPDAEMLRRADEKGVPVLLSARPAAWLAHDILELLG